ncbi:MAG: Do family serine endopeptidase [Calditrichota bacterium]
MDALKKVAVVLFGAAVVLGVTFIVSISAENSINSLIPVETRRLEPPKDYFESPSETLEDGESERMPQESLSQTQPEENPPSRIDADIFGNNPVTKQLKETAENLLSSENTRDSLQWRPAPTEVSKPVADPAITGSRPPFSNPNKPFITAAKRILPAVVAIQSTRRVSSSDNFFHPFWRNDEEGEGEDDIFQPGSGSGILISDKGYIMTNHHVVESASKLRVTLYDKREFDAELIGKDESTDLAVLRITGENLPSAFIGNSDTVQIGEWVMAVGNPLNFTSTVTAGIISALGRDIRIINDQYRIENFIQTDAVINPGNSGGALVNLKGEVVGINTAIATRTGLYQGYGFAIPINLAKKVVNDIIEYGYTRRALLGVTIEQVDDRVAKAVGLDRPYGALIQNLQDGFPAVRKGLRQGDIILKVDGREVTSVNDLQIKIAQHSPGESVVLTIWRDRKAFELSVELGEAPSRQPERNAPKAEAMNFKNLGLSFRTLSVEDSSDYGISGGILIVAVKNSSPAADAGIPIGTILKEVNGIAIKTVEQFEKILQEAESGDVLKMTLHGRPGFTGDRSRIVFVQVP